MMSPKFISLFLWISILGLGLAGCGASPGSGPQTWIDQPLDNSYISEGAVQIQAHASDSNGVSSIRFSIDGNQINEVGASGARLGHGTVEWTPPGPGIYHVMVQAVDGTGNSGEITQVTITYGTAVTLPVLPTSEIEETVDATATQVSVPTATPQVVNTDTPLPPTAAPTKDTSPPSLQSASVLPELPDYILIQGTGCESVPRTATVTVAATDPSGITSVTVFWNVSGDTGDAALSFIGSNTYQGQAGPVSQTGVMSLFAIVEDNAGNQALSGVMTVDVKNCIN
jgi:hypothetical protein